MVRARAARLAGAVGGAVDELAAGGAVHPQPDGEVGDGGPGQEVKGAEGGGGVDGLGAAADAEEAPLVEEVDELGVRVRGGVGVGTSMGEERAGGRAGEGLRQLMRAAERASRSGEHRRCLPTALPSPPPAAERTLPAGAAPLCLSAP